MYNREKKDKYRTRIEKLFERKRLRDNSDDSRNKSGSVSSIGTINPEVSNIGSGSGNNNNLDDSIIISGSGNNNNLDDDAVISGSGNNNNLDDSIIISESGNLDDSDMNPKGSSGSNTINSGSGNICPGSGNTDIRVSRWIPGINTRIYGIRKYLEVYEIA